VVGGALRGIGTTELFLYLHRQHEKQPWRFRVFPVAQPVPVPGGTSSRSSATVGMTIVFFW